MYWNIKNNLTEILQQISQAKTHTLTSLTLKIYECKPAVKRTSWKEWISTCFRIGTFGLYRFYQHWLELNLFWLQHEMKSHKNIAFGYFIRNKIKFKVKFRWVYLKNLCYTDFSSNRAEIIKIIKIT